jgi:hypothetical protein
VASTKPTDSDLAWVQINNFGAGIVRAGLGDMPINYSPETPLGSASYAARCINVPGIGLTPFPSYHASTQRLPYTLPSGVNAYYSVGMAAQTGYVYQGPIEPSDYLVVAIGNFPAATVYIVGWPGEIAFPNPGMIPVLLQSTDDGPTTISFTKTRVTYTGGSNVTLGPQIWWEGLGTGLQASPDWVDKALVKTIATVFQTGGSNVGWIHAHSDRVLINSIANTSTYTLGDTPASFGAFIALAFEDIYFTDPPDSITLNANSNNYTTENYSGYGAWGSIATGELLLVKTGGGGIIVSGDPGFPTSAIYLPGVKGTGNVYGKAIACQTGLIYITETDGAYIWNGSNTAQKVSTQIPDNALLRSELLVSTWDITQSPVSFHDSLGNLVFFANNYVFDSLNNAWWQSEDPTLISFGTFAHAAVQSDRFMWALPATLPNNYITPYLFDSQSPAVTYAWTSNPIPAGSPGGLSTLEAVEVVASNPTATSALVTITPTVPVGQTPYPQQNPVQTVRFIIPPTTVAWRGLQTLGYTDFNVEVAVFVQNIGGNPAPIIHEINLGFKPVQESDWSPSIPSTVLTQFWVLDDPVYGILDQTTILA